MFAKNESYLYQILCLIIIVFSVYYAAVFAPFNTIDDAKMIGGLLNTDSVSLKEIFLPNAYGQYYRPILYLTFIADRFVWGLEASFMHLENILLHLGNTLLVFRLTQLVLPSLSKQESYPYAPFATALLFGLHPIATEPVNWVSGRTDLLSGFFVLLALGFFWAALQQGNRLFKAHVLGAIGAICLLAGCLSKETALFILPVILLWCLSPPIDRADNAVDTSFFRRPLKLRAFLFLSYCIAGSAYLLLRRMALSGGDKLAKTSAKIVASVPATESIDLVEAGRIAAKTAGFYFKKLLMPLPLNFGINTVSPYYFWLGLLVIAGVAWCIYRRDTIAYLFLAAFMLASAAFALPILKITWTPIAERYVYMAAAPFCIGVSLLYIRYIADFVSTRVATVVIFTILASAAVVTAQRSLVWQDNFTLFEDTLKKSPDFAVIMNEYAIALRERGRIEEADSIMLANTVDQFQPSSLNKIRIMVNQGKLDEARLMLVERLKNKTDYDLLAYELLLKIDEMRRERSTDDRAKLSVDQDILADFNILIIKTGDPFYHYRTGKVLLRLGDKAAAKQSFTKAWQGSPPTSHYHDAAGKLAKRL